MNNDKTLKIQTLVVALFAFLFALLSTCRADACQPPETLEQRADCRTLKRAVKHLELFEEASRASGISLEILLGLAAVESNFRTHADSGRGDLGLLQVRCRAWHDELRKAHIGFRTCEDLHDAEIGLKAGVYVLSAEYKRIPIDDEKRDLHALTAYKAGLTWRRRGIKPQKRYYRLIKEIGLWLRSETEKMNLTEEHADKPIPEAFIKEVADFFPGFTHKHVVSELEEGDAEGFWVLTWCGAAVFAFPDMVYTADVNKEPGSVVLIHLLADLGSRPKDEEVPDDRPLLANTTFDAIKLLFLAMPEQIHADLMYRLFNKEASLLEVELWRWFATVGGPEALTLAEEIGFKDPSFAYSFHNLEKPQ